MFRITSREDHKEGKEELKGEHICSTEIFDNKRVLDNCEKEGKKNGFNFESVVTFPPVQVSIFKESYPL